MRRRVTFSRNATLSLSRTCQCYCKYCSFATHKAHLYAPDEVEEQLEQAVRRRAKELLILTGEKPEVDATVAARLREYGHEDFTSYVVWACERALERGLLPHTNLGVLSGEDLARLREVTASQGLMLESISPRLMETVHAGSPTKHPERRLATIRAAGELRIPFTSGILVGIGETEDERMASLEALAEVQAQHGHLQEVILQNFVPHQRYYGQEPAEIATAAAERYWRTGLAEGPELPLPGWACEVTIEDMKRLVAEAARLLPGVGIQIPPNLADWWPQLIAAGATDLGGLSANGDHISPEHPFPSPHQVRKELQPLGYALTERLCVYPQYIDGEWVDQGVMDTIRQAYWSFIPRRGSGRRQERTIHRDLVAGAIAKGRDGVALSEDHLRIDPLPRHLPSATTVALAGTGAAEVLRREGQIEELGRLAETGRLPHVLRDAIGAALRTQPPLVSGDVLRSWRRGGLLPRGDPYERWLDVACRTLAEGSTAEVVAGFEAARQAFEDIGEVEAEISAGLAAAVHARRIDDLATIVRCAERADELLAAGHREALAPHLLGLALRHQLAGDPEAAKAAAETPADVARRFAHRWPEIVSWGAFVAVALLWATGWLA